MQIGSVIIFKVKNTDSICFLRFGRLNETIELKLKLLNSYEIKLRCLNIVGQIFILGCLDQIGTKNVIPMEGLNVLFDVCILFSFIITSLI